MVLSPTELAAKGEDNYAAKIDEMRERYPDAKSRAISGYKEVGFLTTFEDAYADAWDTMPEHYRNVVKKGLESKWRENWTQKMFGTKK